jgi:hypothetical protein
MKAARELEDLLDFLMMAILSSLFRCRDSHESDYLPTYVRSKAHGVWEILVCLCIEKLEYPINIAFIGPQDFA